MVIDLELATQPALVQQRRIEAAVSATESAEALVHALGLYLDEIANQVAPNGIAACWVTADWATKAQAIHGCLIDYVHTAAQSLRDHEGAG